GQVSVRDFTIEGPHRIVVDLTGARLERMPRAYDRRARAGITNLRAAQYQPNVVRVVVELDAPRPYTVTRSDSTIRVSLATSESFAAWYSSGRAPAVAANAPAQPAPTQAAMQAPAPAPTRTAPPAASESTGVVNTPPAAAAPPPAAPARPAVTSVEEAINAQTRSSAMSSAAPRFSPGSRVPLFNQQSQQPRITVNYQDAPLRDVIAGIAQQTGRTIVVGKDVEGTVDAEIRDQPWDVALKAILDAQGLAATEEPSGIIVVDSYQNILERQASEPLTTQLVNINYVSASSLEQTIGGLLSKDCPETPPPATGDQPPGQSYCLVRGSIASDSGTNSLIVTEVTSRLPALMSYIRQLDVRTPQVALKAKIVSVNRTKIEQLGLAYDLGSSAAYFNSVVPRPPPGGTGTGTDDREGRVLLGGDVLAGVANASRRYRQGAALNLLFSTALGNYSLTAFLDALREQQLSDIQAEPSVITLDNRQARILVGQETPVRVIDAGAAGTGGVPPRANVQFKETGIILTVTPHITSNRQIRMSISAEQSELRIVGGDLGFFIDKRNATTQLLVNDGETAVIGGLTQTQLTKNKAGIPLLTDLPLLGRLFSQTDTREEKRDLLILITPHIIDPGEAIRPPGGNEPR
ncbi:MAG TPA: AMIN domain-containing protein, partial [Gemmatimonadaceae bacterium]|nr:AMIN domain-containing protein [Gemmatimonadaceae bacterium]